MCVFQFCLQGLSPGDCTMAIQPLEDNHQYLTKKNQKNQQQKNIP